MRSAWRIPVSLALLLVLAGCGGGGAKPPTVTGATPPPGVGAVRLDSATGPGVADVTICVGLAVSAGSAVAVTGVTGAYTAKLPTVPNQETVTTWAERSGYTFEPPFVSAILFSASSGGAITTQFVAKSAPKQVAPSKACSEPPQLK